MSLQRNIATGYDFFNGLLVISIFIALIGAISIPVLPIENTPDITPPTVEVTTSYPGASAPVIAETVAVPMSKRSMA